VKARRQRRRRRSGASLVETMAGFIIIIPIGLAAIDIVILLSTSQTNEQWAEMAAKAACRRNNEQEAIEAAQKVAGQCPIDNVITNLTVADVNFDITHGQVTAETVMDVKLPIPVPFMPEQVQFRANSTQPIVSTRAPI
jgi:Flp pilus assembly protein TadG